MTLPDYNKLERAVDGSRRALAGLQDATDAISEILAQIATLAAQVNAEGSRGREAAAGSLQHGFESLAEQLKPLRGLVPPATSTLEEQLDEVLTLVQPRTRQGVGREGAPSDRR